MFNLHLFYGMDGDFVSNFEEHPVSFSSAVVRCLLITPLHYVFEYSVGFVGATRV